MREPPLSRRHLGRVRSIAAATALAFAASLAVVATPASAAVTCGGQTPTIVGTNNPDYIVGTPGNDVIVGLGGDDTIRGLGGNDIICGGDGDDLINGGLGDDQVFGEAGNDEIQMSDPVLYCSTTTSNGLNGVETAYEDDTSPAWNDCNPANGPAQHPLTIPDGGTRTVQMNLPTPTPGTTVRDINVRFYVNAPQVAGKPDPCQLYIYTTSPDNPNSGVKNDMVGKVSGSTFTPSCNATGTDLNGTSLDSEAITSENNLNEGTGKTAAMNGRFHPSGSLELLYRGIQVCPSSPCTWALTLKDEKADGNAGSISWWAIEINYSQATSDGTDVVNCGSGTKDTADYTARSSAIKATIADGLANDGQADENDNLGADDANRCEWLYSGTGKDKITGNKAANDLRGEDGNDVIKGLGGQDNLEGGAGKDKLTGGKGYDTLDGGPGTDTCLAVSGDNYVNCENVTS